MSWLGSFALSATNPVRRDLQPPVRAEIEREIIAGECRTQVAVRGGAGNHKFGRRAKLVLHRARPAGALTTTSRDSDRMRRRSGNDMGVPQGCRKDETAKEFRHL